MNEMWFDCWTNTSNNGKFYKIDIMLVIIRDKGESILTNEDYLLYCLLIYLMLSKKKKNTVRKIVLLPRKSTNHCGHYRKQKIRSVAFFILIAHYICHTYSINHTYLQTCIIE